jgi:SAM-dependent methyltransferase
VAGPVLSGRGRSVGVGRLLRGGVDWLSRGFEAVAYPEAGAAAEQYQRVALNRAIDHYLGALETGELRAAEISGANHAHLPWRKHVNLEYPEFDICEPSNDVGRYDVVICEQVLEHVPDPLRAARNLCRLCAPGGHVIVSTPFLVRVHELPEYGMRDYWRFTPRGLRTLLEQAGLEVERTGSWGNRRSVIANLRRWPAYRRWQALENEPGVALQVWAFARAPGGGSG